MENYLSKSRAEIGKSFHGRKIDIELWILAAALAANTGKVSGRANFSSPRNIAESVYTWSLLTAKFGEAA